MIESRQSIQQLASLSTEVPQLMQQEEGVLRDVLDELDKERSKRAELEAKVRALEAAQEASSSQRELLVLKYEVEGYKQIINELTASKPALLMTTRQCTIPFHIIRLLEILPWDPRAHDFIFRNDNLYEWQIHIDKEWQSQLKYFPAAIRNLPIVKAVSAKSNDPRNLDLSIPSPFNPMARVHASSSLQSMDQVSSNATRHDPDGSHHHNPLLATLAGGKPRFPPPLTVMTDLSVSRVYHTPNDDYPLPRSSANMGTWEWIGTWEPEVRQPRVGDDERQENGWVYGSTIQQVTSQFKEIDGDRLRDATAMNGNPIPRRLLRCRRWARRRVLVEYPHMCDSTGAYLRQLADRSQLAARCRVLTEQLRESQTDLTQAEEDLVMTRAQLMEARRLLQNVVMNRNEIPSESQREQTAHDTELIIEYLAQSKLTLNAGPNHDAI